MSAVEHRRLHWIRGLCVTACVSGSLLFAAGGCARRPAPPLAAAAPMPLEDAMRLIDSRAAWGQHPPINIPRHPAEKYLQGWTIVLDPGHGGEDGGALDPRPDYKRGPTGVREADMNLRVALLLQRLLQDAGVNVIMTRVGDETVSLRQRAEFANTARRADGSVGADLFISLHHNAVNKPETNYTSVWYHGPVDVAEPELDVAKYIAHHLGSQLRTDVARTSPILDDKLMYRTGFGVLRMCNVPAVLLESSFFTHPEEEQRLRDAGYNLREAYAIYLGLAEYAYGGRPTQSLPELRVDGSTVTLLTTLDPGLPPWWGADRNRIVQSTVAIAVNGRSAALQFDPATRRLSASIGAEDLPATSGGVITIHHANLFKHHNYPQRFRIEVSPGGEVRLEPLGPERAGVEFVPAAPAASSAERR
jgi:N-acetylmuramoyl-L-alanine amidase